MRCKVHPFSLSVIHSAHCLSYSFNCVSDIIFTVQRHNLFKINCGKKPTTHVKRQERIFHINLRPKIRNNQMWNNSRLEINGGKRQNITPSTFPGKEELGADRGGNGANLRHSHQQARRCRTFSLLPLFSQTSEEAVVSQEGARDSRDNHGSYSHNSVQTTNKPMAIVNINTAVSYYPRKVKLKTVR